MENDISEQIEKLKDKAALHAIGAVAYKYDHRRDEFAVNNYQKWIEYQREIGRLEEQLDKGA